MKPLSTIATVIALGLALGACTSESTTMAQDEPEGVGGSDNGTATQTASIGGSSVAVTTVVHVVEVPKLSACVPGAQTGCACTDGSPGAQVCQDDGTMGACECEVPAGYSGDCVSVGVSVGATQSGISNVCVESAPFIRVNCSSRPANCLIPAIRDAIPGVYCCQT